MANRSEISLWGGPSYMQMSKEDWLFRRRYITSNIAYHSSSLLAEPYRRQRNQGIKIGGTFGFSWKEGRPWECGSLGGGKTKLSGLPDKKLWRCPGLEISRTVWTFVKVQSSPQTTSLGEFTVNYLGTLHKEIRIIMQNWSNKRVTAPIDSPFLKAFSHFLFVGVSQSTFVPAPRYFLLFVISEVNF